MAAAEQFANQATTTLNTTINNSTTTVVVTSSTGFPSTGNFRILLRAEGGNTDEIMTVTAVSGTTWTVTRASESIAGTQSASAHNSGAAIVHVLTYGAIKQTGIAMRGQVNADGTTASGNGFTSAKTATGQYSITFTTAFSNAPIVIGSTLGTNVSITGHPMSVTTTGFVFQSAIPNVAFNDSIFAFIVLSLD